MKLIPIIATSETIDFKKGGTVTYNTDLVVEQPGIILLDNPTAEYGMVLMNQVHPGGTQPVTVSMRPLSNPPVRKYSVGDVVAQLMVL